MNRIPMKMLALAMCLIASTPALANEDCSTPPAGETVVCGLDFAPEITPGKIATASAMQDHIQAISQKGAGGVGERAVVAAYREMGWRVEGGKVISESRGSASLLRAAIAVKDDVVVVAFRGTSGDNRIETALTGILVDGDIALVPPTVITGRLRRSPKVHRGFLEAYQSLRPQIVEALQRNRTKHLFITGHSLGGALATLLAFDVGTNFKSDFASITSITSGTPRVGDAIFKRAFEAAVPDNLRVIVNKDPVPTIPWMGGSYVHAGKAVVADFDSGGLVAHQRYAVKPVDGDFEYHGNTEYLRVVERLARSAPRNRNLSNAGDGWAQAATRAWYSRSKQERRASNLANELAALPRKARQRLAEKIAIGPGNSGPGNNDIPGESGPMGENDVENLPARIGTAGEKARQAAAASVKAAQGTASKVKARAQQLDRRVTYAGLEGVDRAVAYANIAKDNVENALSIAEKAAERAEQARRDFAENATEKAKRARDQAEEAAREAAELAEQAAEAAAEAAQNTRAAADEAARNAADKASETANKAREEAQEVAQQTAEAAGNAAQRARSAARNLRNRFQRRRRR